MFKSFVVFAALVAAAAACSCTMPESCLIDFETDTTPMMKLTVETQLEVSDRYFEWYIMKNNAQFRGCKPDGDYVVIKTPKKAKKCGMNFTPAACYLITARPAGGSTPPPAVAAYGLPVYSTTSCEFNKLWEEVPYTTQQTLYDSPLRHCESPTTTATTTY